MLSEKKILINFVLKEGINKILIYLFSLDLLYLV